MADDHLLIRLGLRAVLAQDPALELVGEARSGREAVDLANRLCPDLVLMDIGMPDMDGLEATSAVKRNNPTTSVLILTMHDDADLLLNALRAGAAGYILKTANETDLRAGIREALAGELPIDRNMTEAWIMNVDPYEGDEFLHNVQPIQRRHSIAVLRPG